MPLIADLSVEVIKEHSEWYKQYLKLQNKKKDAILKWKQNRSLSSNSDKTLLLSNKSSETLTAKTNKKNNTDLKEQLIHWKVCCIVLNSPCRSSEKQFLG